MMGYFENDEATRTVFTAHSLPERVLAGDPYPDQLFESARLVATAAGLGEVASDVVWEKLTSARKGADLAARQL